MMGSKYKFLTPEQYPPGFFVLKNFMDPWSRELLATAVVGAILMAPFQRYTMFNGKPFRAEMTNCGKYGWYSDRKGYRYTEINPNTNEPWPKMPSDIEYVTRKALAESCGVPEHYEPQSCLINLYEPGEGKLSPHIDNTEFCDMPIVSFSFGSAAVFGIPNGNVLLEEGDVCVMSGESRFVKHTVKQIIERPSQIIADGHRLSFTVRQVYPLVGEPQYYRPQQRNKWVVHCKRDTFDVYIGRGSKWGNQWSHDPNSQAKYIVATREEAIEEFRKAVMKRPKVIAQIKEELKGKVLGCWCAPDACHGEVLAEIANAD